MIMQFNHYNPQSPEFAQKLRLLTLVGLRYCDEFSTLFDYFINNGYKFDERGYLTKARKLGIINMLPYNRYKKILDLAYKNEKQTTHDDQRSYSDPVAAQCNTYSKRVNDYLPNESGGSIDVHV